MAPGSRRRAIIVEPDGGRVPFDFEEVAYVLDALLERVRTDVVAASTAREELIDYFGRLASGVKLTTKNMPWKHRASPGSPGQRDGAGYRRGFHEGWDAYREVIHYLLVRGHR